MDYRFMIQVIEDGSCTFSRQYLSALEAVRVFNGFIDHGFAHNEREIELIEPNGQIHRKVFKTPGAIAIR